MVGKCHHENAYMTGESRLDAGDQRNYDIIYCPDCDLDWEECVGTHNYPEKPIIKQIIIIDDAQIEKEIDYPSLKGSIEYNASVWMTPLFKELIEK